MRHLLGLCFCLTFSSVFGQLTDKQIHYLKGGHLNPDTSFIYQLPYQQGKRYLLVQGANSKMSHRNELSFDFKMKMHSEICAARTGIVRQVKDDSEQGGLESQFLSQGNHVVILHADGTKAKYWHLSYHGVVVHVGDTVKQGQLIGYSGNTGYTAFPHLHFQVIDINKKQILPRFQTRRGPRYIRPGRRYKAV